MRVLAVEPYFGGSHRAFLEGWASRSRHVFTLLTLPGHHWKWRMRLGAVRLTERLREVLSEQPELLAELTSGAGGCVWCSSMLDVALWRSLAPGPVAALPHVVYFHENQFEYPGAPGVAPDVRDLHFGLTNYTSALAALATIAPGRASAARPLWWNSAYNRDTFVNGVGDLLGKAPQRDGIDQIPRVAGGSRIEPPGVALIDAPRRKRFGSPLHLVWAARWEHDKRPDVFFQALADLERRGVDFRVSVLGERFQLIPGVFDQARERFAARIIRWGYQEDRSAYERALREADVFVSTAAHEFFGIAAVEAASAGCTVVLPQRLAYPEVFGPSAVYYDSEEQLASVIAGLGQPRAASVHVQRYGWDQRASALDGGLEEAVSGAAE